MLLAAAAVAAAPNRIANKATVLKLKITANARMSMQEKIPVLANQTIVVFLVTRVITSYLIGLITTNRGSGRL